MIHFDLPKQKSSIIKVIGVGGGGSNAVNFMFNQDVEGVDFIVCNTDAKAIEQSKVPNKIQLGPYLTQGLGAGANPEVGKKATEESLEEIKKILEVNTKMAFITVGMGGGTGTGGAPIIAQICKDLGILTVGIVTTPFGFEGPRRLAQAEEGIKQLKPHVDTLLVISNDKLRMQYGNLKMREAFGKADNVLATAAKCITDIINSRGHIIVDFADVCTVMKNGGVAILGKAEVEGEDRAQMAIEEALSSPLLNDNDIKGAKWILININSAEGDDECTMDESETILSYLRMQAGEDTDVIVGMGCDNSLGKKIGITLVATGFDSKNPFAKPVVAKKVEPIPEKIIMTLGMDMEDKKPTQPAPLPQAVVAVVEEVDTLAPTMQDEVLEEVPVAMLSATEKYLASLQQQEVTVDTNEVLHFELSTTVPNEYVAPKPVVATIVENDMPVVDETLQFVMSERPMAPGILNKPSNIYAEAKPFSAWIQEEPKAPETPIEVPVYKAPVFEAKQEAEEDLPLAFEMHEKPVVPVQAPVPTAAVGVGDFDTYDEAEDQRRRAQERIQKLRNLSFNMNSADANSDFETVPAYIRQKMDLYGNAFTSAENFYSKYTVSKDDNNNTHISTINTFLDGKKPD
ncbi:MAG: cell division protein FtsZ [Pedobacter sp.]|nr:cell division protein FtsZ [Chitinophagaceae bacterium]